VGYQCNGCAYFNPPPPEAWNEQNATPPHLRTHLDLHHCSLKMCTHTHIHIRNVRHRHSPRNRNTQNTTRPVAFVLHTPSSNTLQEYIPDGTRTITDGLIAQPPSTLEAASLPNSPACKACTQQPAPTPQCVRFAEASSPATNCRPKADLVRAAIKTLEAFPESTSAGKGITKTGSLPNGP
jgi:hypothetical protein